MSTDNRVLKAITKLNELTQEKKLRWERDTDTSSLTAGTEDIVDVAYYSKYNDKRLRLFEMRFKEHHDAPWDTMVVLEFVDESGKPEWRFPHSSATWHLLESVKFHTSGVDAFIRDLLDEPPF